MTPQTVWQCHKVCGGENRVTMPHLMNCDHSAEGWCLACVKSLEEERYNAVIEAGKYEDVEEANRR